MPLASSSPWPPDCVNCRIDHTPFTLKWLPTPASRRRRLDPTEQRETSATRLPGPYYHRLWEFRDRSYEHQRYRTSRHHLMAAALTLWNTVYMERASAGAHGQRLYVGEARNARRPMTCNTTTITAGSLFSRAPAYLVEPLLSPHSAGTA
ncbi:Tn3 family transposase [Paraburkholderia tagetis]|uniref:Tn3 family transposase n=1 Tax=Paraburkholderia tagetis TaxID=2913261 RepID=UPI003B75CE58